MIAGNVTPLSPPGSHLSPVAALREASKASGRPRLSNCSLGSSLPERFSSHWSNVLRGLVFCRPTVSPSHRVPAAVLVPAGSAPCRSVQEACADIRVVHVPVFVCTSNQYISTPTTVCAQAKYTAVKTSFHVLERLDYSAHNESKPFVY